MDLVPSSMTSLSPLVAAELAMPYALASLMLTTLGFIITIWALYKSYNASVEAKNAALNAKSEMRRVDALAEFNSIIGDYGNISKAIRDGDLEILEQRYAALRGKLRYVTGLAQALSDAQLQVIHMASEDFRRAELSVQKTVRRKTKLNYDRLHKELAEHFGQLEEIYGSLQNGITNV